MLGMAYRPCYLELGEGWEGSVYSNIPQHTLVLRFLPRTQVFITCLASSLTCLVTFQDTKCLAWQTTLRHSHFICEEGHWKIPFEGWEFLEEKKSAKPDSQGWGWGKAPQSACWD